AVFHRKNYFYPDNPKGYQISQYDEPLCIGGRFDVPGADGDHQVGIVRAHLEEDAAKNVHVGGREGRIGGATATLVDLNRAGPPPEVVERIRGELSERPAERIRRLEGEVGLELAEGLVTSGRDRLFEQVAGDRRGVANVLMNQLAGSGVDPDRVDAGELARLIE